DGKIGYAALSPRSGEEAPFFIASRRRSGLFPGGYLCEADKIRRGSQQARAPLHRPLARPRESLGAEVRYHRRKRKLAIEPRLERVVVGRRHVGGHRRHEATDMRRYDLACDLIARLPM